MNNNIEISISKKFTTYCGLIYLLFLIYATYSFINQQLDHNNKVILRASSDLALIHKEIEDSIIYTTVIAKIIEEKIKDRAHDTNYIANSFSKIRVLYDSEELRNILSISMFSWVEKNKHLSVNSEFGVLEQAIDLSKRDYIPLTIAEPSKANLGSPIIGAVSKQYIIPFGYGIVNQHNIYQGTIVAGINLNKIHNKINQKNYSPNSSIQILFNKSINILSGLPESRTQTLSKIDFNNTDIQFLQESSLFSSQKAIIYKNIANSRYGILITVDDLNNKQNFLQQNYIIGITTILSIFIFLIFFFKRTFIDPITDLSKIIKRISEGETNVDIPTSSIKEINQLSNAIKLAKEAISQEYQKNKIAKQENLNKDAFLSSVSHDLRNPISSIKSIIEFIEHNKNYRTLKGEDKRLLLQIKDQAHECLEFTNELLDLQQAKQGKLQLGIIREEDLKNIVGLSVELNQKQADAKKINIHTHLTHYDTSLNCDTKRIKQIFSNLIINSIKYSPPNSNIDISLKRSLKNNEITFEIKDQGFGMTEEEIEMALSGRGKEISIDNFTKQDSHGIGLLNVQQLVKAHNAVLKITSTSNKGTNITINFPVENELSQAIQKTRILMAEDEELNLKIAERLINNNFENVELTKATDGREALNIFKSKDTNYYDLIITDIEMPKLDGIGLAKEIRIINKNIPIIAFSSLAINNLNKDPQQAGIDEYILKPQNYILTNSCCKWSLQDFNYENYFHKSHLDHLALVHNKSVLLADDEKINLAILTKQLSRYKLKITSVNNGKELLEEYSNNHNDYDIIISDIIMKNTSGNTAIKQIRKFEKQNNIKHIPIISYSADSGKDKIHHTLRQGANNYFIKGDKIENLVNKIAFLLK